MKPSVTLALIATFWTSSNVTAHEWCADEDQYGYYEEPYFEVVVPLQELIVGLIRSRFERERPERREIRPPVWEQPGWVAPRAQRPPTPERREARRESAPTSPQPRRVTADYKPPVPPVMPKLKPKQEVEIELTPESEETPTPRVNPEPEEEPVLEMAVPVPGAPGFVFSPFDGEKRKVDVRGLPAGSLARDPYTKEIFRVP